MNIEKRIRLCRLIEKMELNEACCRRIGIYDKSTYRGNRIKDDNQSKGEKQC